LHGGRNLRRLWHRRRNRPDDRVPGGRDPRGRRAWHRDEAEAARGDRADRRRGRFRRDIQDRLIGLAACACALQNQAARALAANQKSEVTLSLFDVAADARKAFDALKAGGIAIVPNDIGYSILGGSGLALRRIFATKGRAPSK